MDRTVLPGRRRRPLAALVCLVVAVAGQAQQVVPRSLANQEGGSSTAVPFGLDQPARVLSLYDADQLPWTGPIVIQAVDLRADNGVLNTTTFAQKQYVDMHVVVSTAARTSDGASATFDDNHGLDRVVVVGNVRLSLPAQPPSGQAPRPCNIAIPFTLQPFFYDLSPVRGPEPRRAGLALEFAIALQPPGDYRLDSPLQCLSTITPFGRIGAACVTSRNGTPLTITPNSSIKAGERATYTVSNMPNDTPFAVALGSQPGTGAWGGVPLPIDLTPLGAHGCHVNTDWLAVTPALADQTGSGQVSYSLPPARNLVGRSLHAQAVCRDLAANAFLHVTSLGVSATVCGPLGVARVAYVGGAQARQGSVTHGSAFVMTVR